MDMKTVVDKSKMAALDKKAAEFEKLLKEAKNEADESAKQVAEREKSLKDLG